MIIEKRKTKGIATSIDVHVGLRLRQKRQLRGLSQEKMAEGIGLTFQQIQKYERGLNRVSAGRLYQFAQLLEVSPLYFYEGLTLHKNPDEHDPMDTTEAHKLVRAWFAIKSEATRKAIMKMIKVSADGEVHAAE